METRKEPRPADSLFERGATALNERRYGEAEEALRASLDAEWGSGSEIERRACVNLVTVLLMQNRIYEAFVLANRAKDLWAAAGEPSGVCVAWRHMAAFHMLVGDIPRLEAATKEAEALLSHLPERLRAQTTANLAMFRMVVARRTGRPEEAFAATREAEAESPSEEFRNYALEQRSALLLDAGRYGECRALVEEVLGRVERDAAQRFRLEDTLVRCAFHLEGKRAAVAGARPFLERLQAVPDNLVGAGARMRLAERMAVWLAEVAGEPELARRAFEIACGAALVRIREVEDFRRQFPRLRVRPEGVAEIVDEVRARYREEHAALLGHLSTLLGEMVMNPPEPPPGRHGTDPIVCVCAWCRRARGPDTVWVPLAEYVPPPSGFHVSHGICEDCLAEASGAARA